MNYIENKSQEDQILEVLQRNFWERVALPEILRLGIAQYNARIWWLRKKWYKIENKISYKWKTRHTFFRILND